MARSSTLKSYQRRLSRQAARRANPEMQKYFGQNQAWNPFVGWWDRTVGMRLRPGHITGDEINDPAIVEIAVDAVIDEIMDDPAPFIATLLEDQISDKPHYKKMRPNG